MKYLLSAALFSMGIHSVFAAPHIKLELSSSTLNSTLPSASGLSYREGFYYAVGDDSKWLYQLDSNFNITDTHLIKEYPIGNNGRIAKSAKPDFEAMAQFRYSKKNWHMILGSGSKAGIREVGFVRRNDDATQYERSLAPLYAQLKAAAGIAELNIEGLAMGQQQAFILNRGNGGGNYVFVLNQQELIDYMLGKRETVSTVQAYQVKLPSIANFEAGLSGGDFWAERGALVYTASVEATGDSYNDGQILGSFIGLIPLKLLKANEPLDLSANTVPMLDRNGHVVLTKAESLALVESDDDEIKGAIASDNDNGTSEFFTFKLELED